MARHRADDFGANLTETNSSMAEDIAYRVMTEEDESQVKQLLYASFFTDEPLGKALKIKSPDESAVYVENLAKNVGKGKVSIVAICRKTGDIVGCRLSVVETPTCRFKIPMNPDDPKQAKIRKIITFLSSLHNGVDIFEHYGVDRCLHFQALNVRSDYGGRGIGKRLVEESINVAKANGIKLIVAEVSGKFSQRIYEKLGFDVLKEVQYDDYVDDNGIPILGDTGIHTSGRLVGKLYKDE